MHLAFVYPQVVPTHRLRNWETQAISIVKSTWKKAFHWRPLPTFGVELPTFLVLSPLMLGNSDGTRRPSSQRFRSRYDGPRSNHPEDGGFVREDGVGSRFRPACGWPRGCTNLMSNTEYRILIRES